MRLERWASNALIVTCLYVMIAWNVPDSQFRLNVLGPAAHWIAWSGLWQDWSLFAPDPMDSNLEVEARVSDAAGHRWVWKIQPREALGPLGGLRHEHYHKIVDLIRRDENQGYRAGFADYVARQVAELERIPAGTSLNVQLVRRWIKIEPPLGVSYQPILPHYEPTQEERFYERRVPL